MQLHAPPGLRNLALYNEDFPWDSEILHMPQVLLEFGLFSSLLCLIYCLSLASIEWVSSNVLSAAVEVQDLEAARILHNGV
jgi:hypothetical protein